MKKGIVMEQQNEYMIVMTRDGKFHKAEKIDHADIGMEVQFKTANERKVLYRWTQVIRNHHTRAAVIAIIFLLMVFPVFLWYGSNQAFAYMNIDINPSVELELNEKMQVIDMTPQNEEAEAIVSSMKNWKKKDASEVTFELIEWSQEKGYVNDANQVLIGISYLKEEVDRNYTEEIETFLMEKATSISIATFLVPKDLRKEAIDQKASVNEMIADKIKKEERNQTGESDIPVHVEDDDREIIQSFYKDETSEEEQQDKIESGAKSVVPPVEVNPEKQAAKGQGVEQADQKGRKQAPGQQKKDKVQPDQGKSYIDKKDKKKKHIEKKNSKKKHIENKNDRKEQEKGKTDPREKTKPLPPQSKEIEKSMQKGKNLGSKHNHEQDDQSRGKSTNKKEKSPQSNGHSNNGKHS